MAVDKRLEVEIALRDTASLTLKAIADQLENINKALAKGGSKANEGADAFKKIKETTEGVRKTSEEGAKNTTEAAERLLPLSAQLMRGALARATLIGAAATFAIDAITDVARERQEWAAMATDTGLQEGFISMLAQAQRKLGVEKPQALANIKNIMSGLGDMAYGRGGQVSQALMQMNEGAFANELENIMMSDRPNKGEEAVRAAMARYDQIAKVSEREALRFAAAMRVSPSFFKDLSKEMLTVVPSFEITLKDANHYMKIWTNIYMGGANAIKFIDNAGTVGGNKAIDVLKTLADYGYLKGMVHGGGTIPEDQLQAFRERNKETLSLLQDILSIFQRQQNKESIEKRWVGGSVMAGRKYMVGEKGPERFRSNAGWESIIEGPEIIEPKTGGEIIPGTEGTGGGGGTEGSLGKLFSDLEDRARFNQRFGDWGYRFMGGSWQEHPRAGRTPEETWEALNKGLNSEWGWGVGTPEGRTPLDEELGGEAPTARGFRSLQSEMEVRSQQWPGWREDLGLGQPGEQPINFRSMMDDELGGGSGSLGAQIEFRNVPEDVTTDVDADGFDSFTVNKTRQLEGA